MKRGWGSGVSLHAGPGVRQLHDPLFSQHLLEGGHLRGVGVGKGGACACCACCAAARPGLARQARTQPAKGTGPSHPNKRTQRGDMLFKGGGCKWWAARHAPLPRMQMGGAWACTCRAAALLLAALGVSVIMTDWCVMCCARGATHQRAVNIIHPAAHRLPRPGRV